MEPDAPRLAAVVAARRRELGRTRARVHQDGGPSLNRLASIENATGPELSPLTLTKLDTALEWAPGSAARVYAGGDPTPLAPASPGIVSASTITITADELAELISAVNVLVQAHTETHTPLSDAARTVQRSTSHLAGRWVTEVLERNRLSGTSVPPIIELAFGHLLEAPVDTTSELDTTERLYRRWLLGRSTHLTPQQQERFTARLNRRSASP